MKIGIYPGCSLKGGSREYLESVLALANEFEIDIKEISDWNCCGATAAHNLNHELSLSLPARILALAEKDGYDEVVVPCAACYSRLAVTKHELAEDEPLKKRISEIIDMPYNGTVGLINVVQFLQKYIVPDFQVKQDRKFNYKVACYYGCLLVRPHQVINFDRPEDPQSMDNIMKLIGAEPVDWAFKTECCGAGLTMSRTDTVAKLSGNILEDAVHRGAEVIVVACPMCHSNLDMRRPEINKYLKKDINIPVLYITQAMGIAAGIDNKKLGLQRHFVYVDLPYQSDIEKEVNVEQKPIEE
jgi:heterodisulfide reductase subunit B2